MNKARVVVILGLIASFFIALGMVPFDLPVFTKESYIIALFFPFITRKYRLIVTSAYQVIHIIAFGIALDQLRPFIDNLYSTSFQSSLATAAADSVIEVSRLSYTVQSMAIQAVANYNPTYLIGFLAILIAGYVIFLSWWGLNVIAIFTQPYSLYFLYERIGLVKRVERAIPYANSEWWRT